ncbi:hypothetical protein VTJ04DRAFT_3532 [Mycothermus thermophilus]|uniref:uncharacterized protein n=1 Tax=Humicola insolens TaxID=85995 RepID=UPI00374449D8
MHFDVRSRPGRAQGIWGRSFDEGAACSRTPDFCVYGAASVGLCIERSRVWGLLVFGMHLFSWAGVWVRRASHHGPDLVWRINIIAIWAVGVSLVTGFGGNGR